MISFSGLFALIAIIAICCAVVLVAAIVVGVRVKKIKNKDWFGVEFEHTKKAVARDHRLEEQVNDLQQRVDELDSMVTPVKK